MILSSLTWTLVALTILAQTTNRIATKYALFKTHPLPLTIFTNLTAALLLLPFVWRDLPTLLSLNTRLLTLLVSTGIAWGIFGYVYNVALEKSPVSVFTVITQLQIILIVIFGAIFLNQNITANLLVGVLAISFASILVNYKKGGKRELTTVALLLCLATAVSGAVAVFLDSYNIRSFDIGTYAFAILMLSNIPLYLLYRPKKEDYAFNKLFFYLLVGVIFLAGYMLPLALYSQPDAKIAYIYPLLRTGAIFSVIIGILLFQEKTNWKYKIIAVCIASIGAIFIKLA